MTGWLLCTTCGMAEYLPDNSSGALVSWSDVQVMIRDVLSSGIIQR